MRSIIVGSGVAGVSAAAAIRRADADREIILLGDEDQLPYRRPPVSKEVFRGEKTADQIRIKKPDWYEKQHIDLRTATRAEAIDTDAHTIDTNSGQLVYDQLLLATGGSARILPDDAQVPGSSHTLRTVGDVPRLRQRLDRAGELLVIGAGLIGSEIAASARSLGYTVTMLETASLPLTSLLPPVLGSAYADIHRAEGVDLHTDVPINRIDQQSGTAVVGAADGRTWRSAVAVVAIGMRPATGLARDAGIAIAPDSDGGGIIVDAFGRTSAPDVWAAGDVANFPHPILGTPHRIEHWQHAQNHGSAVGHAMAGAGEPFLDVPWCWSDQYGLTLQVAGWPDVSQEVYIRGSPASRNFSALFCNDGVIVGAVSLERPRDIRIAKAWIRDRLRPDPAVLGDDSAPLDSGVSD